MRLFVGLSIPEDVSAGLGPLQSGLAEARWVSPANFHVTLRFIGETNQFRLHDLEAELAAITAPAFDLELAGLGTFSRGDYAHALWAGVRPEPALDHIQAKVAQACRAADLPGDERKFKPHITLARFNRLPLETLAAFMEHQDPMVRGRFSVNDLVLYRSHLGSDGPHYEAINRYPLTDYAGLWSDADEASAEPGQ